MKAQQTTSEPLPARADSPARVTLSRRQGWRMPPNTVKVCRPGRWGNPYRVGVDGDQAECVELFRRNWGMFERLNHADIVKHLRGKNLACWCKAGTPCHADVLLSLANDQAQATASKGLPQTQQTSYEPLPAASGSPTNHP